MSDWQKPIKPPLLQKGDRVGVVSPSWGGPSIFPHRYEAGKRQLIEALDVDVVEMPHALADAAWIAQNPEARANDIMQAFADPSINAIIASIGGEDSIRLAPYLDLSIIRNNPKIFLGYSDATALHLACMKAGVVSFYGPSIMAGFGENGGPHDYMLRSLRRVLCSTDPIEDIEPNRDGWTVEHSEWADPANQTRRRTLTANTGPRLLQGKGRATGPLIGGCAEVLDMVNGSPWWPPLDVWHGAILFYETDGVSPDFVRYWMRNFAAQGILQNLSGILLARPGGQIDVAKHDEYGQSILRVLTEENLTHIPLLTNMDFGHTDPICTLPYGLNAEIDCDRVSLRILENAVVAKSSQPFQQARPAPPQSPPATARA